MKYVSLLIALLCAFIFALACGGGSASSTAATTGSATLSGTISEGVLSKAQYSGNESSYSVTATNSSTSAKTTGSLTTLTSSNTVLYNVNSLGSATEYDITVWKGAGGSNTVVVQVTATTENSGSSKPRSAASSGNSYELNTFSTFYTKKVVSLRASGNSDPARFAKYELFPLTTAANINSFADVKVKNGIATMVTSGNRQALVPNAKANASIKFITQLTKSVVYMSDDTLIKQSDNLQTMADRATASSNMSEISNLYKDNELGFSDLINDVKGDLPAGVSFGNIIAELDPVLANLDFIEAIDDPTIADLDAFFDLTFESADNLTKTMYSYELALETFTRDIVEFTYDIDTELFFEDFQDEFSEDTDFSISSWTTEAMGDLKNIFDADFDDGSDDFEFEFGSDDLSYLYADLSNEILDVLANEDGFDVSQWDDSFDAIDFGDGFEDLDFELGALDEDLLALAIGTGGANIQILDVRVAHPTYGYRMISPMGNVEIVLSSLAPVFRIQLLPNQALSDNLSSETMTYGDMLDINLTLDGNVVSIGNSILYSTLEEDVFYIAYHKAESVSLPSTEFMPGKTYEFELVAGTGVDFFDIPDSSQTGNVKTKDITFTLPFDGTTNASSTQVDLLMFFPEFFGLDVIAPDKSEFLKDISSAVFDASEADGSTLITGAKLTLASSLLSNDGTYELRVMHGDMLMWNMGGATTTVSANSYQSRNFYDVMLDSSFLTVDEKLSIEGSQTQVAPLSTATPSIYVHSAYGIVANSGVADYDLFGDGKLKLQALNHSEALTFDDDSFGGTDGFFAEDFIGVWVNEQDSVLTVNADFTWSDVDSAGNTDEGIWEVIFGVLFVADDGEELEEESVSFNETFTEFTVFNADGTTDTKWTLDLDGDGSLGDGTTGLPSGNLESSLFIGDWVDSTDSNSILTFSDNGSWSQTDGVGGDESGLWEVVDGSLELDGVAYQTDFNDTYTEFTTYNTDGTVDTLWMLDIAGSGNMGSDNLMGDFVFADNLIGTWTDLSVTGNTLTISDNNTWTEADQTGVITDMGEWEIISGNVYVDGNVEILDFSDDYTSFSVFDDETGMVDQVWTFSGNGTAGDNTMAGNSEAHTLNLVSIQGGTFEMGEAFADYEGSPNDYSANVHTVTVSDFEMSDTEVTNQQYVDFLNSAELAGWVEIQVETTGGDAGDNIVYGTASTNAAVQGNGWLNLDGTRVMKDHGDEDGDSNSFSGNIEPENPLNISFIGYDSTAASGNRFYIKDPESDFNWSALTAYYDYTANSTSTALEYDTSVELNDFENWPELQPGNLPTIEDVKNWPANFVRWQGAKAFALFYGYDLPTEAEWEYAAQGGGNFIYATNDGNLVGDGSSAVWNHMFPNNDGISDGHVEDVKSNDANPYGLYNLAGNVWEWVEDYYAADYYVNSDGSTDPVNTTDSGLRVRRGGSWNYHSATLKSAARFSDQEFKGNDHFGFRVVQRTALP